jgi:hypothetical protein
MKQGVSKAGTLIDYMLAVIKKQKRGPVAEVLNEHLSWSAACYFT